MTILDAIIRIPTGEATEVSGECTVVRTPYGSRVGDAPPLLTELDMRRWSLPPFRTLDLFNNRTVQVLEDVHAVTDTVFPRGIVVAMRRITSAASRKWQFYAGTGYRSSSCLQRAKVYSSVHFAMRSNVLRGASVADDGTITNRPGGHPSTSEYEFKLLMIELWMTTDGDGIAIH